MRVEEVQIVPLKPKDGLLGFASFVLDGQFYIGNVGIYSRKDGQGIRLVYPTKNGMRIAHPINREIEQAVNKIVEKKFTEILSNIFI